MTSVLVKVKNGRVVAWRRRPEMPLNAHPHQPTPPPEFIVISSDEDEKIQLPQKRSRANREHSDELEGNERPPRRDREIEQLKEVRHACCVSFLL